MSHKSRKVSLHKQAYDVLTRKLEGGRGTSKKKAKEEGTVHLFIFSYSTYNEYRRVANQFCKYVTENYPNEKKLKGARKHVPEWLDYKSNSVNNRGELLSPHTIQTYAKALGKLYDIDPTSEDYYVPPTRHREDTKKGRVPVANNRHFNPDKHPDFVHLCVSIGLRRHELELLMREHLMSKETLVFHKKRIEATPNAMRTAEDRKLYTAILDALDFFPDTRYFVYVYKGKGGRARLSPIFGEYEDEVIQRIKATPNGQKVCVQVFSAANIHGYRAQYAVAIYNAKARPIDEIPYDTDLTGLKQKKQGDVYVCRGSLKGIRLDRKALVCASKALGHNRESVIPTNYIYSVA